MSKKKWIAALGISALLVGGVLSGCSKDSGDQTGKSG